MTWLEEMDLGIKHLTAHDARLARIIEKYSQPTFRPHSDYYRALAESIISQQLSVKAAATIYRRFVDLFGHVPEPEEVLTCNDGDLRSAGLSGQKIRYIKDLAKKVSTKEIRFEHLNQLSNDEIVAELTAVKGVGEWTVHMFLIFYMGRFDVLPTGDLGIKNAIQKVYSLNTPPTKTHMLEISQKYNWRPYESLVSWYLWRSLDNKPLNSSSL